MKDETKKKLKKVGKIVCGVVVGALALLGVISLGGMAKSCSKGESTPVVTTPVVSTMPKKVSQTTFRQSEYVYLIQVSDNQDAQDWYQGWPFGMGDDVSEGFNAIPYAAYDPVLNGWEWQTSDVNLTLNYQERELYAELYDAGGDYLFYYSVGDQTIRAEGSILVSSLDDVGGSDGLIGRMILSGCLTYTQVPNPIYQPTDVVWPLNYSNTGGYWVDSVTGGVVTSMIAGQSYDLVWVSVQGYLYPTDVQAEAHTSIDGGIGIFDTKDGRVHMDFLAGDPTLSNRIDIVTNLSSLAIPGGDTTTGNDQVNTATGLSNSFALLGSAFASMAALLSMEVFPGLSLSALLFVPVVVAVILFILKAIGK